MTSKVSDEFWGLSRDELLQKAYDLGAVYEKHSFG